MAVTQFLHATLLVTDLEVSQHFYETVLKLTPVERSLSFAGVWYQVGPVQIHLVVAASVVDDCVNTEKWGRNRHLAFAVANLEHVKQRIESFGYEFQLSASGRSALFVRDPDGNLIELAQG